MNHIMWAWRLLYITYGVVPIVAGLDKYFNYIVTWKMYLNTVLLALQVTPINIMHVIGAIEIAAGILVLVKPRFGGYIVAAWLIAIAANLASMHIYYDIAIRDCALAMGACALALLSHALNK